MKMYWCWCWKFSTHARTSLFTGHCNNGDFDTEVRFCNSRVSYSREISGFSEGHFGGDSFISCLCSLLNIIYFNFREGLDQLIG